MIISPFDVGKEKLIFCVLIRSSFFTIGSLLVAAVVILVISMSPMTAMHKYMHQWTQQEEQVWPIADKLFLITSPEQISSGTRHSDNKNGDQGKVTEPIKGFVNSIHFTLLIFLGNRSCKRYRKPDCNYSRNNEN